MFHQQTTINEKRTDHINLGPCYKKLVQSTKEELSCMKDIPRPLGQKLLVASINILCHAYREKTSSSESFQIRHLNHNDVENVEDEEDDHRGLSATTA